jgi:hypothetical protein
MEKYRIPRLKSMELHPYDFDEGAQNIHSRKDTFLKKWCCENWIFTCRRLKQDPYL